MSETLNRQKDKTEKTSRITKSQLKLLRYASLLIIISLGVEWFYAYSIGFSSFNKSNAVSIFSSVIQGMSALLSVSIAVIIFRIQSLENRSQLLEESTLNFIFQTTRSTYPKWIPSVEEDIRSGTLTKRYYEFRIAGLELGQSGYNKKVKEYADDRDAQQKRLEETLNLHTRIEQTIERISNGVLRDIGILILPIMMSFFALMISDSLDVSASFSVVSAVVLFSVVGVEQLMEIVVYSTIKVSEEKEERINSK